MINILKKEKLTSTEWVKATHKIKGSSISLGVNNLSKLCGNAETASAKDNKKVIMQEIASELGKVEKFIEKNFD